MLSSVSDFQFLFESYCCSSNEALKAPSFVQANPSLFSVYANLEWHSPEEHCHCVPLNCFPFFICPISLYLSVLRHYFFKVLVFQARLEAVRAEVCFQYDRYFKC